MATNTARLLLQKPDPDPVTGDFLDVSVLNSNFDKIDAALGAAPVTSSTRPASPFHGQLIRETDTRKMYVRNATQAAWDQVLVGAADMDITGQMTFVRATGGTHMSKYRVTGDTQDRFLITADGSHAWGPGGSTSTDTYLYRDSTGVLAIDGRLLVNGPISGLYVTENVRTTGSASITTVETVIQSVTFSAQNGVRYRVDAVQSAQSSVLNDTFAMRLRWSAGATVTSSGTRLATVLGNADVAAKGQPYHLSKTFISNVTGQVTVGVTLVRDGGTGNVSSSGQSDRIENTILITTV